MTSMLSLNISGMPYHVQSETILTPTTAMITYKSQHLYVGLTEHYRNYRMKTKAKSMLLLCIKETRDQSNQTIESNPRGRAIDRARDRAIKREKDRKRETDPVSPI